MKANHLLQIINIFLSILIMPPLCNAASYYVDATNGNDADNGLSQSAPWKTIAKVNSSKFNPGDQILFKMGEVWREQLDVPSSGALGNPIVIGPFGDGMSPVINGSDLSSGFWSALGANTWSTVINSEPKIVFFDGIRGNRILSVNELKKPLDWVWLNNTLYVYALKNPLTLYTNPGIEVGRRSACIFSQGSFVIIRGLHATKSNSIAGIFFWTNGGTTEGITVEACLSSDNFHAGIRVANAHASLKTINVSVTGNIVYENGASGIDIGTGVNGATVEHNIVYNNNWSPDFINQAGIHFWGNRVDGDNLTIRFNESYGNIGTDKWKRGNGLHLDEVGSNVVVANNRFYDNHDLGILVENSKSVQIYYNLIYRNGEDGILVFRSCSGAMIFNNVTFGNKYGISIRGDGKSKEMINNWVKNNISVGNNISQLVAIFGGENDGSMGSGNIYEYNCFGSETADFIEWGAGTTKSTYANWETAYKKATHSVTSNPFLLDPPIGSFEIGYQSPCIDSGANVGLLTDYNGNKVPIGLGVDIGAFEFKGLGAPTNLKIPNSP